MLLKDSVFNEELGMRNEELMVGRGTQPQFHNFTLHTQKKEAFI